MKLLFVALLAIVAVAESRRCEPNTTFKSYCNTCRCSANGETAICTLIGCDTRMWNSDGTLKDVASVQPRHKRSTQECVPHSTFKDYCNTCTCGADGKTMACTLMYCNPEVWNKDGTLKSKPEEPKQYCEPHSHFKDYCNSCICSRDGKTAACTLMDCDPRVWNKDGTLKDGLDTDEEQKSQESQKQVCEPNTTFKDYCNTCRCGDDGVSMACTLMACDPAVWNKDGTRKTPIDEDSESEEESDLMCEPNSTFKDYCNTCKCSRDGKNAACTLMACDPRVWNKDGTMKISLKSLEAEVSKEISQEAQICEPRKAYSPDGCNTCICNEDGTDSLCTMKLCISNLVRTHSDKEAKKWGPLYKQGDQCTPRESFYSECNICICDRDGKSAFCTYKLC